MMMITQAQFSDCVMADPNSGCWLWTGHLTDRGYGIISVDKVKRRAHRVAFELFNGAIPDTMFVCHKCDTPPCVNPQHLFLGTNRDNVLDARDKWRHSFGIHHPRGKLTDAIVRQIRVAYAQGTSASDLARRFGISVSYACRLVRFKQRRHHLTDALRIQKASFK